jgi:hypothetical protein
VFADQEVQRRADPEVQRLGSRYPTPRDADKGALFYTLTI